MNKIDIMCSQAEKEEQAAKEIAPAKDFAGTVEVAATTEPGWVNEVDTGAVAPENWADDVATPTAAAIPTAGAAQAFQASGDWAAQVKMNSSIFIVKLNLNIIIYHIFYFRLRKNGPLQRNLQQDKVGAVQQQKNGNFILFDHF